TFTFSPGKNVTGTVDGGGGSDVLDYSQFTAAVTVNLQSGLATATGGFQNIETIVAGKATSDKLIAANLTNSWNITGKNAGNVGGVFFQNIENLTGGAGDDSFAFAAGQSITGKLDGAAGNDTLDYSAYTTAVTVNLQSKKATGIGGAFANVEG